MLVRSIKQIIKLIRIVRQKLYTKKIKIQCKSFKSGLTVNYASTATKNTVLGANVNFNGMKIKGNANIIIGDNFHSGQECLIISDIHNYDNAKRIPYDDTYILKDICIEDNVWLGDRVIILGGVTIGEGAIIQAGSVVTKNVPKYSISGGHPAMVFKMRDVEHYQKLKKEELFH